MKVSIITSCYNRAGTLRDAIESVLAQDYKDVEYIIVDGASTDNTMDIVREYSDKISCIISEPDRGMYEAINKGIRRATGDIVGLVHSDDMFYDTHVISSVVERMKETCADFLYANGIFVDANNLDRVIRDWEGGTYKHWKVKNGWLPLHPTCYIKRELLLKHGLYDESLKIAADTDLLLRYLSRSDLKVTYLDKYIIRMRMGGLSTAGRNFQQVWHEDIKVYSRYTRFPRLRKIEKMMWKINQFM